MNSANRPIRSTYEMSNSKSRDLTGILVDVAKLFGVGNFKDKQIEAFKAFVSGKDTLDDCPGSLICVTVSSNSKRKTLLGGVSIAIARGEIHTSKCVCVRSAFIIAYHFRNTSGQNKNGIAIDQTLSRRPCDVII